MSVEWLDVYGLYAERWQDRILPEAMAHPAKAQPAVARWLVKHGLEEGYWRPGDVVCDPFGGVGGFLMSAGWAGLQAVGCELERRFWQMAGGCDCAGVTKAQWVRYHARGQADKLTFREGRDVCPLCRALKYEKHSGIIPCSEPHRYGGNFDLHVWDAGHPRPVIVHGDSRRLSAVIGGAVAALTSQPYEGVPLENKSDPEARLARLRAGVASGKITGRESIRVLEAGFNRHTQVGGQAGYGTSHGNLGNMRAGDVAGALTSQPYANAISSDGSRIDWGRSVNPRTGADKSVQSAESLAGRYGASPGNLGNMPAGVLTSQPYAESLQNWGGSRSEAGSRQYQEPANAADAYGSTAGQLGAMKAGCAEAAITSQPFEDCDSRGADHPYEFARQSGKPFGRGASMTGHPQTEGSLAQERGDTFWAALRDIFLELHKVLKPGGVVCNVVGDFVRNKQRVNLCDDTCRLFEATGFRVFKRVRLWKISPTTQERMFGPAEPQIQRKSFFRRLAEDKGSPRIDFEEAILAVKETRDE